VHYTISNTCAKDSHNLYMEYIPFHNFVYFCDTSQFGWVVRSWLYDKAWFMTQIFFNNYGQMNANSKLQYVFVSKSHLSGHVYSFPCKASLCAKHLQLLQLRTYITVYIYWKIFWSGSDSKGPCYLNVMEAAILRLKWCINIPTWSDEYIKAAVHNGHLLIVVAF
jgi:hypothetical protein